LFVDAESMVTLLQQGVKTIQDRWVAKVSVLEQDPFSLSYCFDEDGVDPLKAALALLDSFLHDGKRFLPLGEPMVSDKL
jgi:hypothetical protein